MSEKEKMMFNVAAITQLANLYMHECRDNSENIEDIIKAHENLMFGINCSIKSAIRESLERVRPGILGRTPDVDSYMYEKGKLEFNGKIDMKKPSRKRFRKKYLACFWGDGKMHLLLNWQCGYGSAVHPCRWVEVREIRKRKKI